MCADEAYTVFLGINHLIFFNGFHNSSVGCLNCYNQKQKLEIGKEIKLKTLAKAIVFVCCMICITLSTTMARTKTEAVKAQRKSILTLQTARFL